MNLDKRCINSGYVVAADPRDDSFAYSGNDDPHLYYSEGQWTHFERLNLIGHTDNNIEAKS